MRGFDSPHTAIHLLPKSVRNISEALRLIVALPLGKKKMLFSSVEAADAAFSNSGNRKLFTDELTVVSCFCPKLQRQSRNSQIIMASSVCVFQSGDEGDENKLLHHFKVVIHKQAVLMHALFNSCYCRFPQRQKKSCCLLTVD